MKSVFAIVYLIIIILCCIFLIWYIKSKEKQFKVFLQKYDKTAMVEGDYQFYILNLYIALYVWHKPINNYDEYLDLLKKYLK